MEILEKLFNREKSKGSVIVYTTREANKLAQKGAESILKLQNNIIAVNFSQDPQFTDPSEALMCLEVLTSDGKKGSISHLQTDANVDLWVKKLLGYHGQPCSVCLSGGEDGTSDSLISGVSFILERNRFTLSDKDIGGNGIYRIATLFSDHVNIMKNSYSDRLASVTLQFK